MNPQKPTVEAIAVKDGMILAAGDESHIMSFAQGAKTKIIDLKGKTLLPGFIDPHVHLLFSYFNHWVNLGPFVNENMSEVEQKLKEAVKK